MAFPTKKALTVTVLLMLICQLSMAPSVRAESTGSQAGIGIGAFFATLVYAPAKMVYAIVGGLFGGGAYVLSGGDTVAACRIWTPSIRGTYVLTPGHLRGEEPIRFAGLPAQTEEELQTKPTEEIEDQKQDANTK
jgi:hypothetical protein